jgi:hypothetical protein
LLRRRLVLYRRLLREGCSAQQAALYLMEIRRDEAEIRATANEWQPRAEDIDPTFLRMRAMHYRELADKADEPKLANLCRELAEGFERDAEARERTTVGN